MESTASPDPRDESEAARHESEAERDDRNLAELLQELRVAGLGVQVLFGFLLRRGQKEGLVRSANVMAILGLAAVALAVSAAVLLVTSYVAGPLTAVLITAFIFCSFAGLWFAFPFARRR